MDAIDTAASIHPRLEMDTMRNYLTYSPEETKRTIESLELEMGTPEEYQVSQLIQVIRAWHEGPDNGWWEVWCLDCDQSSKSFHGSIEDAAARFIQDGWVVDSLERFTVLCKPCANYESPVSEREAWEDEKVYEMRKGEQG